MIGETDARIALTGAAATVGASRVHPRVATTVIAAAIPALLASAGWWLGLSFVAALGAGGVVVGPLVAYRRGDRLAGTSWRRTSIVLGVQAAFVASIVTGVVLGIAVSVSYVHDPVEGTAVAFLWAGMTLAFGMVLGSLAAVPTSFLVGFLVHRAGRMPRDDARRHLALLVAVTLVISLLTVASATGVLAAIVPSAAPIGWPS